VQNITITSLKSIRIAMLAIHLTKAVCHQLVSTKLTVCILFHGMPRR